MSNTLTRRGIAGLAAAALAVTTAPLQAADAAGHKPPKALYAVTLGSNSQLVKLSPRTKKTRVIGNTGVELTDVTFSGKTMYAVGFTSFFKVDASTGATTLVGPLGVYDANALTVDPATGTLWGLGNHGSVFTVEPETGHATLVGSLGGGLYSQGDLVFARGKLYATVAPGSSAVSYLARLDVTTGAATVIGKVGAKNLYGLVAAHKKLFGGSSNGRIFSIDKATGKGTMFWKSKLAIAGMTTH